jgi:hypothetical protein
VKYYDEISQERHKSMTLNVVASLVNDFLVVLEHLLFGDFAITSFLFSQRCSSSSSDCIDQPSASL